jgi:O-methyltransferase
MRALARILPPTLYDRLRRARRLLDSVARARAARQLQWTDFEQQQRRFFFQAATHYIHINRNESLTNGLYLEFGCHSARTMRLCWEYTQDVFQLDYVAFDSFEGLPEIGAIDQQPIWEKGKLKTAEVDFADMVSRAGMPRKRLTMIKGFYDQSLTDGLAQRLLPRRAAIIYVDCDLYLSTVPILDFIKPLLQEGAVIAFDDWNCFWADPNRGERLAWKEFLMRNPELHFEEFVSTHMLKSFIFVPAKANGVVR